MRLPDVSADLTTHHDIDIEGGTGHSNHDTTPSLPVAQGVAEPTRRLVI